MAIEWDNDMTGEWSADSCLGEEIYWKIEINDKGLFTARASGDELLPFRNEIPFFERLKDCQRWCEKRDKEISESKT